MHKYVLFAGNRAGLPCCWYSLLSIGNAQNAWPGILGFPCGQLPTKERERRQPRRVASRCHLSQPRQLIIHFTDKQTHTYTHQLLSLSLVEKRAASEQLAFPNSALYIV